MQQPETTDKIIFNEEEIENISKLVKVVRKIRSRLIKEGVDLDYWRLHLGITRNPDHVKEEVQWTNAHC